MVRYVSNLAVNPHKHLLSHGWVHKYVSQGVNNYKHPDHEGHSIGIITDPSGDRWLHSAHKQAVHAGEPDTFHEWFSDMNKHNRFAAISKKDAFLAAHGPYKQRGDAMVRIAKGISRGHQSQTVYDRWGI